MKSDYEIRPFETIAELRACVDLQEETWGRGFSERVSAAILKVSQILGGVAAGAYDDRGELAGFVFGMTGVRDGEVVHWSDMLAVREGLRDAGLGTRLKAYQRRELLARGIGTMYWTFDPLQARNAYMNFAKLGIVVREYVQDMYGETDSPLHRGIGTDRFIALWRMDSARVRARIEGRGAGQSEAGAEGRHGGSIDAGSRSPGPEAAVGAARALGVRGVEERRDGPRPAHGAPPSSQLPTPDEPDVSPTDGSVLVAIPSDVGRIMDGSMELALEWRGTTRRVLTHYLAAGYEVRELLRGEPTCDYLLVRAP